MHITYNSRKNPGIQSMLNCLCYQVLANIFPPSGRELDALKVLVYLGTYNLYFTLNKIDFDFDFDFKTLIGKRDSSLNHSTLQLSRSFFQHLFL